MPSHFPPKRLQKNVKGAVGSAAAAGHLSALSPPAAARGRMNEEQANYHELREQLLRKQQRLTYAIRDGGTAEVRFRVCTGLTHLSRVPINCCF